VTTYTQVNRALEALGNAEVDPNETFRRRPTGTAVRPHVHEEPTTRVPNLEEIGRLVQAAPNGVGVDAQNIGESEDAGSERRSAVPAR
jgi:hypothetical protein